MADLEDIPTYRRPIGAQRVLGEMDELGNPVYRMPSGKKFTLMEKTGEEGEELAEQDRWPLGKAAKDLREGLWEFLKNPEVPSWSQIKQLPTAIAQGMQQTIENPTVGNVLGTAAGMGTGSLAAPVPEGALRIFGGRKASNGVVEEVIRRAKESDTDLDTVDPDALYERLGVFRGLDGQWRQEIPTAFAGPTPAMTERWSQILKEREPNVDMTSLTPSELEEFLELRRMEANVVQEYKMPLSEVLDFPELYEAYPQLADTPVRFLDKGFDDGQRGSMYGIQEGMEIHIDGFSDQSNMDQLFGTIMHEIQHGIQEIEGFDAGSSPITTRHGVSNNPAIYEESLRDIVDVVDFLEPLEGGNSVILGQYNRWVKVDDEVKARKLRGMTVNQQMAHGADIRRDGVYELVTHMAYKTDEGIQSLPVPRNANRNPLFNTIHAPTELTYVRKATRDGWKEKEAQGKAVIWKEDGIEYAVDVGKTHNTRKFNTKLINMGLDQDYMRAVAVDGRDAYKTYSATLGEVESRAVQHRFLQGRAVAQHIPENMRNQPFRLKKHPHDSLLEQEQITDGEAIRRPRITEDD